MKNSPLLAIALFIGCATGAAVSQVALAPARAQAAPAGWEYTCHDDLDDHKGGIPAALAAFTKERWELVTASQSATARDDKRRWAMCFKRAVY